MQSDSAVVCSSEHLRIFCRKIGKQFLNGMKQGWIFDIKIQPTAIVVNQTAKTIAVFKVLVCFNLRRRRSFGVELKDKLPNGQLGQFQQLIRRDPKTLCVIRQPLVRSADRVAGYNPKGHIFYVLCSYLRCCRWENALPQYKHNISAGLWDTP